MKLILFLIVLLLALGIVALAHRSRLSRCSIFGHDDELKAEGCRIYLRCVSCGEESPGWSLSLPLPAWRAKVIRFRKRTRLVA
jgi:hypothetical protein